MLYNSTSETAGFIADTSTPLPAAANVQDGLQRDRPHPPPESINDSLMIWKMRWCFFWVAIAFCFFWISAMIGLSFYVLYITGSVLSLLISAASAPTIVILRLLANFLLPMSERQFLLKKLKIEMKARNRRGASNALEGDRSHIAGDPGPPGD
jgi:hypothetical protein